jgi:Flp pilus assembly protein TadG
VNERGVSALEVALLLPFLLLITMGIVDLGRMMYFQLGVQEAAQEGIVYASIEPDDPTGIVARTMEAMSVPDLAPGSTTVTCPAPTTVMVTVTHQVDLLTPVISQMVGGTFTASSEATTQVFSLTETCIPS